MTKYINADAHLDNMFSTIESFGDCLKQATYRGEPLTIAGVKTLLRESLRNAPAADVVEVRHGRWEWKKRQKGGFRKYTGIDSMGETHTVTVDERHEINEPFCPYCGKINDSVWLNFCPNCGVKMDEEE